MKLALASALLAALHVTAKPLEPRGVVVADTAPLQVRDTSDSEQLLAKRGVTAETTCRNVVANDLWALDSANWQIIMNNANQLFNIPVTTFATPLTYKYDLFAGTNYGGWNAKISVLRQADIVQYGQNPASTCLDGDAATMYFTPNQSTCSINQMRTYGTSKTAGTQITLAVEQGYTLSTTVTTTTENHVTFEKKSGTTKSSGTNTVDIDQTTAVFGVDATVGAEVFGITAETTVRGTYEHQYGTSTEKNNVIDNTDETTNGSDKVTSSATAQLAQQDYTTSVQVQITPPTGYTCYVNVSIATCTGSAYVQSPITFPSGMLLIDFGTNPACLKSDPGCSQGTSRYFYVPINTLVNGYKPSYITDQLTFVMKSNGQYAEHCDAPSKISGSNGTTTGTTSYDSTYVPTLTCPKNLGIKRGCSVTMEDYLSEGVATGDTSMWAAKAVSYSQLPGAGQNVTFGQQSITFNASTPYQTTTCTGLLQVVPDFSASFVPATDRIAYPQDGSDLVGASYTVGYVSKCGKSQYGTCSITNVTSQNTKNFVATQTSPQGNPVTYFTFSNGGSGWPEEDVLTFNVECSDVYGNTGGLQSFQQAYRNDVATSTLTANSATYTFQSTTQYLFSAIETLYTSMVTPVATVDLKTQTVYIATTYTGTTTIPVLGAKSTYGGRTTTTLTSTVRPTVTSTKSVVIKAAIPTVTKTLVKDNTTTVTSYTTLPTRSVTRLGYPTVTATATKTLCLSVTSVEGARMPTNAIVAKAALKGSVNAKVGKAVVTPSKRADEQLEDRKIHSTTTITDALGTHTVTDYTNTATRTVTGTTTSTDAKHWATSTVKSTSTYYDPFQTTYVYGTASLQSTKVVNRFTRYNTITRSRTVTVPITSTRVVTTSVSQATITQTQYRAPPTVTATVTPAVATFTTALSSFTTTTTTTTPLAVCTWPLTSPAP